MNFKKSIKKLEDKRKELDDKNVQDFQHQKGKLSARERINLLLDPETFVEIDPFVESRFSTFEMDRKKIAGDGVITGFGKINDRLVYVYSQDFSKIGGSLGEMHGKKIVKVIETAKRVGCPVVGIIDSGGARIQEGIASLDGYAEIFRVMVKASGVIPQITCLVGPSAGGASYAPGLSDFVFMVDGISHMYITGPAVIESVVGEKVSFEQLGGATVHSVKSGCAHFVTSNEEDCFLSVKKLLSYLPQNNLDDPPYQRSVLSEIFKKKNSNILDIIPQKEEKGYDMKEIIKIIFDPGSFFEIQENFATNAIVGFARLSGWVVGVVASQTRFIAGTLDIDSSDKVARFVRFCDAFNIPLVNLVDTPGYLPGTDQEHKGIIRHGAKVLYAYAEASVPKISVILRKAFGGAYIALASRKIGYDFIIAWPFAQIAVMGPEQAVKVIYKKEIAESENPKETEKEKIKEYKETFLNPWQAAKLGQVDMIIHPQETRDVLIKCIESLLDKREEKITRKHGNIPL
ncbi:MAG: acyl-CoA carboxylase subunit beta [Candidatus Pacebacteria bacterium]|nr:acyl-CoA carboxylase subunit beta [Candidatus Paceibacterota bacterium]